MNNTIEELLKDLGLNLDGLKIPIANDENKRLEEIVEEKMQLKTKLLSELKFLDDHVKHEKKTVIRLEKEREQNQKLLTAHSARIEMEKHLWNIAHNTKSSIVREIREFQKEQDEVKKKNEYLEKDICNLQKKLDSMSKMMRLKNDHLLQWEEDLNKKEECNLVIEDYLRIDEKKFKECEFKRVKLREEVEYYRQAITKAIDEMHELEIIQDNTTKLYTEALKEHCHLMNQWTESVFILQQKDRDIQETLKEISKLHEINKNEMQKLQEAELFLKNQITNNKEVEYNTKQLQKDLYSFKQERQKIVDSITAFETEVHVQKKVIQGLGRRTENMRTDIKQKKIDVERKQQQFDEMKKHAEEIKTNLDNICNKKMDVACRTNKLEEAIKNETKKKETIIKNVKRFQDLILKTLSQITDLENEQKVISSQIQCEKKKIDSLILLRKKEEEILQKRKEDEYQLDFECQKCEMKLRRILGNDNNKKQIEQKQKKLDELQQAYNEKLSVSKLLQSQIADLNNDMRKITNCLANGNEQLIRIKEKKQHLALLLEGGEKQLKAAQAINEEKQVEENILRLRVCQADKILSKINDKVYNLEKYKLEIEEAMQERKADIKVQKEALIVEKRLRTSENTELNNMITERKTRIQQLQIRYSTYLSTLGTNGNNDTSLSTTYLKIQSAQERFFLKQHGDNLDRAIRKCEHEIQSMENTLRLMNFCNDKYKSSLTVVEANGPEETEETKLREEMYKFLKIKRERKRQLEEKQRDLEKMQDNYKQSLEDVDRIKKEREIKEDCVETLEREISEQQNKILRAEKSLRSVFRKIQSMCACTEDKTILLQEKDIAVRELKEVNSLALHRIAEFMIRHVEVEAYIKKLLSDKDIVLPSAYHLKPSPPTSRCTSSSNSLKDSLQRNENRSKPSSSKCSTGSIVNIEPTW